MISFTPFAQAVKDEVYKDLCEEYGMSHEAAEAFASNDMNLLIIQNEMWNAQETALRKLIKLKEQDENDQEDHE